MMDKRELLRRIDAGETFEYHFFWKGPLSQWEPIGFTVDGVYYERAEHYMMAEKAKLFNDQKTCGKKFVQVSDLFYIVRWVPNNPIEMFGVGFNSAGCGCGGFLIPLGNVEVHLLGFKNCKVLCA